MLRPVQRIGRIRNGSHFRRRLEDHVGIGAAEPERADPGDEPAIDRLPGRRCRGHPYRQLVPGDVRAPGPEVEVCGNGSPFQRSQYLQHTGDPGRRLEMADVGLDRADDQRPGRRPPLAEYRGQRMDLDRVSQRRAGSVGLHIAHLRWRDAGRAQGRSHDRLLSRAVGRRQARAPAVLVDGAAAQDRKHPIARLAVGQPPDDDRGTAFAADVAVRRRVKGLAAAVRSHHPRLREVDVHLGRQDQVDAADDRLVAVAASQALDSQVQCDQGRGTRGIHGEARPVQAEEIGKPPRQRARCIAGAEIRIDPLPLCEQHASVVAVADAEEDAGIGAMQRRRRDAGILQRMPGSLEHEALLRVHALRFAR